MGDACTVAKLPKPSGMRNIVANRLMKGLAISAVGATLCAWYWKVYHMDYRQRKTKEFFATFDEEKDEERMRNMGLCVGKAPDANAKPIYAFWNWNADTSVIQAMKG